MQGRSRRPPRDPFNALLSFAYALLHTDVLSTVLLVGLDPATGFLHADRPGRMGLVLDLIEEFRAPIADAVALTLVTRRRAAPDKFGGEAGGGVRMEKEVRGVLYAAYEKRVRTKARHAATGGTYNYRQIFEVQVRLLAKALAGEIPEYLPFVFR